MNGDVAVLDTDTYSIVNIEHIVVVRSLARSRLASEMDADRASIHL